jgi:D-sedoheptulose 7-phosphate isomerase
MTHDHDNITLYLNSLKDIINRFPIDDLAQVLSILKTARREGKTIFVCGNGGSWATANHMVCDFGKNTRLPGKKRMKVIGLGDNLASLTAYANDEGYDRIFAEPLISLMAPGDVLIAISGSGNSPNILQAVEAAQELGGITIGLTGFKGGKLKALVQHALIVPSDSMEMIEDFHMIIDHILTCALRDQ